MRRYAASLLLFLCRCRLAYRMWIDLINGSVKSDYIFMASNVAHPVKLSLFIMFVISMPLYRYWICHQSLGIYLSRSISLLTAVISFLICTFPFFYYVWFHIFDIPYAFSLNYFMFTSTNLLLIWGHLVWFVLHHYFNLIVFFWFSSSLFFHCLYFLWTIFN